MSDFGYQRGFTLIELLISISLIAILAAATTVASFPSAEELSEKSPEVAISGITRKARNVAHLYGKNVFAHVYIGEPKDNKSGYRGIEFPLKDKLGNFEKDTKDIKNSTQLESIKTFLSAVRRKDAPNEESLMNSGTLKNNEHKTFVILEDEYGQLLFDSENLLQYTVLTENSTVSNIFKIRGRGAKDAYQEKIAIYPNGLNDIADINFTNSSTGKNGVNGYQGKINSLGKITTEK